MPWLGYFDKMDKSDIFVFIDDVQYKRREYQNRNRIKTSQGRQWLTVPVADRYLQKINEVPINNTVDWRKKHLHALELNYKRAPYFEELMPRFREFYRQGWQTLSQLNIACVLLLKDMLKIRAEVRISSEMEGLSDDPNGRLIDICRKLGSVTYLAGRDGRNYMDLKMFEDAGINVLFQEFSHPVYPQLFDGFEYFMSVIDLLFNYGNNSLEIIRGGVKK